MLTIPFRIDRPYCAVAITFEALIEDGVKIAGIYHLEGTVRLPPKAWLRAVRVEVAKLEQIAKEAGCAEIRIAGRDWSRILPGYERFEGVPNGLRKVL